MQTRRTCIIGITGCIAIFSGCLSGSESSPEESLPGDWHDEPVQASGDPLTIEKGIGEDVGYDSQNDEVQIDGVGSLSVEQWLTKECPQTAAKTVNEIIDKNLDDPSNVSVAVAMPNSPDEKRLEAQREAYFDGEGNILSEPNIEFSTLRDTVPKEINLTVRFRDHQHTCNLKVYVRDIWFQES
ncbi:hypothetical protein [Haloarcula sp. CBA1127]|uniref:hypothetical protein n=1 Tax=Haloarcula sp. CBA1127 TaxID=1765055 RepID=UPI0012ABD054|nr:hypothetical protein [Haloarcula sp. CBA1127]